VNGEKRQVSNTSHMSVSIPQILSKFSPAGYSAGDIITTGTVSGVAAFSADPKAWYLKPGDVVEAEIEHIGVLRNHIISWQEAYGTPAPAFERW
jgi:2-keto-4-pentenoate hydratase/2-oxohepta-3-ene-1,7-dioic acid hydratase in catechol pathway